MTPERKKELAAKLGLDEIPEPRYADLPPEHEPPPLGQLVNFKKALACVDALSTAAFARFIPAEVIIDQSLDPRAFHPEASKAIIIRADLPPPVNKRITRATGIQPICDDQNLFQWLSIEMKRYWDEWRLKAMSPPLVFRTYWSEKRPALIGLILKLDLSPRQDGTNWQDQRARIGLLVAPKPSDDQRVITTKHSVA